MPATLGYVIATPSELPRVRAHYKNAPPQFPFLGKPERGLSLHSLPLGRVGEGLLGEGLLGFSLVCTYATIFIQKLV